MSDGEMRIVAPKSEPDTAPDANTKVELAHAKKGDKKRSTTPTPTSLLHDHHDRTELRLIEEVDQARDKNDGLVTEIRDLESAYSALRERHRALESQRSSATVFAGIGALLLGLASFRDREKMLLIGLGAATAIAAIFLDVRSCFESRHSPIEKTTR